MSHIGRIRHMASIYRLLAASASNLEVLFLKNDSKLASWGMKRAAEYSISFDQSLKPLDILDKTLFTDAALNIGLGRYSDQGHWFKNNWKDIQLHHPGYSSLSEIS